MQTVKIYRILICLIICIDAFNKSTGTCTYFPISNLFTSALSTKSSLAAILDVSVPIAFLNQLLLHN